MCELLLKTQNFLISAKTDPKWPLFDPFLDPFFWANLSLLRIRGEEGGINMENEKRSKKGSQKRPKNRHFGGSKSEKIPVGFWLKNSKSDKTAKTSLFTFGPHFWDPLVRKFPYSKVNKKWKSRFFWQKNSEFGSILAVFTPVFDRF